MQPCGIDVPSEPLSIIGIDPSLIIITGESGAPPSAGGITGSLEQPITARKMKRRMGSLLPFRAHVRKRPDGKKARCYFEVMTSSQSDTWYRAVVSRDPRFDGVFFIGV